MVEPLVSPEDLVGYPGAPYSATDVERHASRIRGVCGWHIAPEITEVLTLDSRGGRQLHLPTLMLVELILVEDLMSNRDITATCRFSQDGMIETTGAFPVGFGSVRVTMRHGYPTCPTEILDVIASFRKPSPLRVSSESLAGRSISFFADESAAAVADPLAPYRLGSLP